VILAAGGVVVREAEDGTEVLVVHRPRYDDWTFPKGKIKPGESEEECAVREVEEETGLRCELERELPSTSYLDARGRQKRVRYWLMRPISGELRFLHEVDDGAWLAPEQASQRLSYMHDRPVLQAVRGTP
jgi:8-oxo-dGTP pyrophosphatase MutT (NUDIX family)